MSEYTPTPIDDPAELCQALVSDYQRAARRMGDDPTVADLEQIARSDLELIDASHRESLPPASTAHSVVVEEPPEAEELPAFDTDPAQTDGVISRLIRGPTPEVVQYETLSMVGMEKRNALLARIRELTRKTGDAYKRDGFEHFAYPRWAKQVIVVYCAWATATGPFAGVRRPGERDRIYFRLLEDLCDRSRRDLGPWWIK